MFGDMFEDEEDYSLSAFSATGGRGAGGRRALSRPAEPRPSDGFVGLLNQGATCYLNSLIQALYMTPELRAGLFDLSLDDLQVVTTAPPPPVAAATAPEADAAAAAATTEQDSDKSEEPTPSGPCQAKAEHATVPAAEPATEEVVKEKESREGAAGGGAAAAGEVADDDDPRAFLASMGFEEAQVRRALARFANDTARAVEWLLSGGGGGAAAAEDDDGGDNDDGFGGLAGMASTLQGRDTEDAETDISGFGEQDPFGEGELFEGAADAFGSADDDDADDEEVEDSEERRAREAEEQAARDKAEREEKEWKEREKARKEKQEQEWSCHLCTFLNHPAKMFCGVCETRRQQPDAAAAAAAAKATAGGHSADGQTEQAAAAANGSGGDAAEEIVKNQQGEQVIVKKRKIPMELQRLFARMQAADVDAVSTESLTESFGWQGREMFEQQDVHELNRVLFDAIERSLKNTPACNLISDLYKGVTVNQIVCTNCKNVSEREEAFQDVTLTVAGLGSVTASLAAATEYEMLTGDNRYHCENCGQRVDALKGAVFRSLPPILILSLSRFTYDVERDGRVKVGDKFAFPLLLDLHPFTEQARAEGKPLGDYHIPAPGVATTQEPAPAAVSEAEADVKEADAGVKEAADVEAGGDENKKKTKGKRGKKHKGKAEEEAKAKEEEKEVAYELEQGPVDVTSPHLYELFSVIIHCGSSAGFGHYHAYIRDVLHTGHEDQSTTTSTAAEKAKEEEKVEETTAAPAVNDDHPLAEKKNESGGGGGEGGEGATRARWEEMAAEAGRGWYDFNDSTVKPIPVQRLATQYAGRSECAYMLIYRHVPAAAAAETCAGEEAARGRDRRVTAPPPVPEHLLAELATYNADLRRERGEYERDRGLIDVMTYHPRHFRLLGGQIHKRIANTTHHVAPGAARGAAAAAAADKAEGASGEERDKKLLTLHKDTAVAQLVKDIKEALGGETEAETDEEAAKKLRLDQVELRGTQLTFSGLSLLLADVPADATLESIGIQEGSSLSFLLWDGETINGERYDPEAHQINIRVTHYASRVEGQLPAADVDPVVNELVVRLGDMETVSDLKTRIATLTGIPVDKQYLCRIEYQKFTHLAENNISLIQLGIYNESKVTVELQPVGSERSWAWEMFLRRQKLMEIFVTDKCSGEEPFPTITVEMDKKATLAELKAAVLSKFPSGLMDLNLETQLRRSLPGGGEGTVYADETRTLDETGVKDGDRIIIEHGDASQHVPIVGLRFVVSLSGTKERAVPEPLDIDVPRNAIIAKCKEMMCAMFDKPADKSRLRRTDIWGGPDRLFDDERRTLDEAKVLPGDLLWLEDGKPPVRGQIEVFFQLYFRREAGGAMTGTTNAPAPLRSDEPNKQGQPQPGDTQKSSTPEEPSLKNESESEKSEDEAKAKSDREKERLQVLRSLVSPAVHLSRSFPPSVREAPDAPFAVSSLFKLDVSRATTVRALKEQLKATAALDHVPSADHIRLWHQERLLKHDRWPLKKHHVANYSTITVEILDSPETSADWREECGVEAAPTPSASANAGDELMDDEYEYYGDGDDDVAHNNALLLYVHRRDPVRRTIEFVSTQWFGGETAAQLRSEVAQATGIDRAHLQLVKYLQYNGKWRVLDDEVAEDTVDSVAGAGDNTVDSSKQPATATVSDDDEEEDEEEQEEDEGTEMVEMTASTAPTVDGETEPNSATMTAEEVAEELKVAAVVAKEQERRERAEAETETEAGSEVLDHRSPYHLEPQQQRGNASRRKIEGKPYYLKDGDVVVAKDRREEPEGHPDDFHESLCLMPERDFGGGKKKKRRERGRKDGNWTNQPRGGTTRRAVERGIRIDVDEF